MMSRRALVLALAVLLAARTSWADGEPARLKACVEEAETTQRLRNEQKLLLARQHAAACQAPECPGLVREDCARWEVEIERDTPRLVVRVVDGEGRDVPAATVELDGAPIGPDRSPRVDPGPHRLAARAEGRRDAVESVTAYRGETVRTILRLDRVRAERPSRVALWAPAAVGGIALVTFGVLETQARVHYANLEDACSPRCSDASVASVEREFVASRIALGVFAIAAVTTLGVWLFQGQ